jgi:regulator of sigma E protease
VNTLSFALAFVGFALLVILHELGHFTAAKLVGMRVERFSLFFPPILVKKRFGETEYCIGAIPAGGYVKITGMNPDEKLPDEVRDRAYHAQPVWKRIVVIAAGPAVNLVLAFVLLFAYFAFVGSETPTNRVGVIEEGFPAERALKPGDEIIAVDGKRGGPETISRQIQSHHCTRKPPVDGCTAATPVKITVERKGERKTLALTPVYDDDLEDQAGRTRLGFGYATGPPRATLPAGEAFTWSANRFWFFTEKTLTLPARLIDAEKRKEISGIVGTYEVTRQTILSNVADAVSILAIISLSLAIVNLFPFLPLDGGHIFWAIVEKVRRKPVSLAVMERAGVVGFMLVILLFLVGLSNDIGRLSGEGFQVR